MVRYDGLSALLITLLVEGEGLYCLGGRAGGLIKGLVYSSARESTIVLPLCVSVIIRGLSLLLWWQGWGRWRLLLIITLILRISIIAIIIVSARRRRTILSLIILHIFM
jgi:hypothetical protein